MQGHLSSLMVQSQFMLYSNIARMLATYYLLDVWGMRVLLFLIGQTNRESKNKYKANASGAIVLFVSFKILRLVL